MIARRYFAISLCLGATLSIGLIFAVTDIAAAGTVSRDHRGANGASSGGVTVNGQKAKVSPQAQPKIGGPTWKGGYDALGRASGKRGAKSGVTVRDHRTCGFGYGRPNRPCE
jgi:hypothetical protein